MSWQSLLSLAFILFCLGGLEAALWQRALGARERALRRKAAMRRARRMMHYPGDGVGDDPSLAPWARALERLERDG